MILVGFLGKNLRKNQFLFPPRGGVENATMARSHVILAWRFPGLWSLRLLLSTTSMRSVVCALRSIWCSMRIDGPLALHVQDSPQKSRSTSPSCVSRCSSQILGLVCGGEVNTPDMQGQLPS